jgi:tRNA/tmRNA/rRNA uracil-C5-methylase (TrmA/RlmC/RlmD family)
LTGSAKKKPEDAAETAPTHLYEIVEVHLFDLFPQTFHIETLVHLRLAP